MELFRLTLFCLHLAPDHWIWRFPANQQQWQALFRLLVLAGRADTDHPDIGHGRYGGQDHQGSDNLAGGNDGSSQRRGLDQRTT